MSRQPARHTERRAVSGIWVLFSRSEEGWTFIGTIIVIGIVLILTSTVGFMAFRYVDKPKVVAVKSQIENLVMVLNTYYLDCKQYPTAQQGLGALWQKPVLEPVPDGWNGPYLDKKISTDPWGHPYKYEVRARTACPSPSSRKGGFTMFDSGAWGGTTVVLGICPKRLSTPYSIA